MAPPRRFGHGLELHREMVLEEALVRMVLTVLMFSLRGVSRSSSNLSREQQPAYNHRLDPSGHAVPAHNHRLDASGYAVPAHNHRQDARSHAVPAKRRRNTNQSNSKSSKTAEPSSKHSKSAEAEHYNQHNQQQKQQHSAERPLTRQSCCLILSTDSPNPDCCSERERGNLKHPINFY